MEEKTIALTQEMGKYRKIIRVAIWQYQYIQPDQYSPHYREKEDKFAKMVVMLQQCCCGCSLKTGAIIIGVLELIAGISNLVVGITTASSVYSDVEGAGIAIAVFSALLILNAVCLVIAAMNGNALLLVPWMLFNFAFMIAYAVTNIIFSAQNIADGYSAAGAGNIVGVVIYVLFQVYFLLVVYSLFRELKGTAPPTHP